MAVYMHSTVKLHQFQKPPKKFLARPPQTETQPQKAKIEHFLMKEPKVSLRLLKRREIVNLSPLFYALKRRRVHKFGFAPAAA